MRELADVREYTHEPGFEELCLQLFRGYYVPWAMWLDSIFHTQYLVQSGYLDDELEIYITKYKIFWFTQMKNCLNLKLLYNKDK